MLFLWQQKNFFKKSTLFGGLKSTELPMKMINTPLHSTKKASSTLNNALTASESNTIHPRAQ